MKVKTQIAHWRSIGRFCPKNHEHHEKTIIKFSSDFGRETQQQPRFEYFLANDLFNKTTHKKCRLETEHRIHEKIFFPKFVSFLLICLQHTDPYLFTSL